MFNFFILQDPRTQDYFMISTPWPCIALLGFYIYFIYYIGPRFMARRQPFQLNRILQIYNVSQIILNAYIFYKVSYVILLINFSDYIYKNKNRLFYHLSF